jgi:hypothetical protein
MSRSEGVNRSYNFQNTLPEPPFSYKSPAFVFMVMRVAVTTPVKEVTTLFVSGASSVNVPEKWLPSRLKMTASVM